MVDVDVYPGVSAVKDHSPGVHLPEEIPSYIDYLRCLAADGIMSRSGGITSVLRKRFEDELLLIEAAGLAGLLLVLWKLALICRSRGETVDTAGGLASSLLLLYALGISWMNPLSFDLFPERYLCGSSGLNELRLSGSPGSLPKLEEWYRQILRNSPQDILSRRGCGVRFRGNMDTPILERGEKLLRQEDPLLTVNRIPLDDTAVLAMAATWLPFSQDTGRACAEELKAPARFEDAVTLFALLEHGSDDDLVKSGFRTGAAVETPALRPEIRDIFLDTEGVPVFDEQLIRGIARISGVPQCEAAGIFHVFSSGSEDAVEKARGQLLRAAGRILPAAEEVVGCFVDAAGKTISRAEVVPDVLRAYRIAYIEQRHPEIYERIFS